jgi:hypothetical protein
VRFRTWGAPPCPGRRGPAGTSLRDGKPSRRGPPGPRPHNNHAVTTWLNRRPNASTLLEPLGKTGAGSALTISRNATSPTYAENLIMPMRTYNLYQYDRNLT